MLSEILSEENLNAALEHLSQKHDSCGIDGMFLSELPEYLKLNKEALTASLCSGTYQLGVIRMVEYLGKNGKVRMISKLNSIDRLILRAFHQVLNPLLSESFSHNSFAYRENLGVNDALEKIRIYVENGAKFVVELDLKDFFDHINHELLLQKLSACNIEADTLRCVASFLKCRIERDYQIQEKQIGLVQGSPLSPLFSNLYLSALDQYMDAKEIEYVRFSDDIRIFTHSYEEGVQLFTEITDYISNQLHLPVSTEKSGVFNAFHRSYFGYELLLTNERLYIRRKHKKNQKKFRQWKTSALNYHNGTYHLVADGILTRKDFSLLFENEQQKVYLPVEVTDALSIHSKITMSSDFLQFANQKSLIISFFDDYGNYMGSFYPALQKRSAKNTLLQSAIYLDPLKRLQMAKRIIMAATHNVRSNLRYYNRRFRKKELENACTVISSCIKQMNEAKEISSLMLIEARMREVYYECFDVIIQNKAFEYHKRSRRPPRNAVNSMISFGNTVLYQKIASQINQTALDIRISFLHSANRRNESLNLDLAELFKPIIVDRIIFTLINKRMIDVKEHFEMREDGGVYLNREGKAIFLREFENKMHCVITENEQRLTYEKLIRTEIKKLAVCILEEQEYIPYKYQ